MAEIWMDGERYHMTLPSADLLSEIMCAHTETCSIRLNDTWVHNAWALLCNTATEDTKVIAAANDPYRSNYLAFHPDQDLKEQAQANLDISELLLYWRPLLTPLDRAGNSLQDFYRCNPNGSITVGGSILLGTKRGGLYGTPYVATSKTVALGDTDGDMMPISWMWWNGQMISDLPLCKMPPYQFLLDALV